ncbi:MAG: trypsin-like serine protease [bacterium]
MSRTLSKIAIVIALGVAAAQGVACNATEPESPTRVSRPIIDGTPDTSPAHKAVVALMWGSGPSNFCSGTLIAPEVVLTAAHCVVDISPTLLEVFFGNDVDAAGERREVVEVMPHPLYEPDLIRYDLGLVRLGSPAPADATPIPYLPVNLALTAADQGALVDFVGFGQTENNTSGLKLIATGAITRVCDGPDQCTWNGAPVAPAAFAYSMVDGGPCHGDSGGPAFVVRQSREYVAGVTSYGDADCTFYGVSTRPAAYAAWIDAFIAGVPEDCASPGDEDADSLADCADPDCDEHPACSPRACHTAETLGCGDEITDTTVGGMYHLRQYSCAGSTNELGPERAYVIDVPRGLDAIVTLWPEGDSDLDLFILPYFGSDCAEWDCLDASLSTGAQPEQLTFHARSDHGFVVVDTFDVPGPFTLQLVCDTSDEDCTNGIDDDADGDVDCEDADCAPHPACLALVEQCGNGQDDDGDGDVDCADSDCTGLPHCQATGDNGGCRQSGSGAAAPPLLLLLLWLLFVRRRQD